jgi:hypothetical protein
MDRNQYSPNFILHLNSYLLINTNAEKGKMSYIQHSCI